MPITDADLSHWFTYHPPTGDQPKRYAELREAGMEFAREILRLTPPSADQSAAILKVREAVMCANASIACEGR
jgi:hypothetical protein